MADYTPKEGAGSLFTNKHKDRDTHPDERGDAMINGVLHEVAAWVKTDRNGNPFRSLSIKPKQAREPKPAHEPVWGADRKAPGAASDDFDDSDVPF